MANIHFTMQGKGGVGKSVIASHLHQFYQHYELDVQAFDTDPVNATLSGYKGFHVTRLNWLSADGNIDSRKFDILLEILANAPEEQNIIIDNGASSFIALCSYMREVDMLETLGKLGHKIFFHTVITGGQALEDTIKGFIALSINFANPSLVVWLNPFFGAVEKDGKKFTDFQCYNDYKENIHAIIELPTGNKDLIGKDLEELFMRKESFKLAIAESKHIAVRSRLNKYWNQILQRVEEADLV